tara:strand:+ start:603 stop:800 length:198 start_codon:yes stop_codon:yes gene_type:complete
MSGWSAGSIPRQETPKNKYEVGVKIINRFLIEASSEEEAAEKVKEMLHTSVLSVDYVHELNKSKQ